MQDNISCALITAFERQYDTSWDDPKLRNERLAMRYGWTAAMEAKQCLHQIQEPAAAEQAAWHAGLDEGRAQATGSVSNATSQAAPAAVAVPDDDDGFPAGFARWYNRRFALRGCDTQRMGDCEESWRAALAATPAAAPGKLDDDMQMRCRKCGEQVTIEFNSARIVTHNPHTGMPRDARDMTSDPAGKLIVAPGPLFAAAAPAGWKLVPMEPTAEMLESASATDRDGTPATYKTLYMAMVGASPAAAPVVLPEPDAWLAVYEDREGNSKFYTSTHKDLAVENDTNGKPQPLYTEQKVRALLATATGLPAQADARDAEQEVLMEHSGCGSNTQVDMLTVRLNPGDKVVMHKGRITQGFERANRAAIAAAKGE